MEQFEEKLEAIDPKESDKEKEKAEDSGKSSGKNAIAQKIAGIVENSWKKKLVTKETYDWYKEFLANGEKHDEFKPDTWKETLKLVEDQHAKGSEIYDLLQKAKDKKIASKNDEQFLLESFVHHPDFARNFTQAKNKVTDKIKNMEREKNRHKAIKDSPLAEDLNIKIVDEGAFLDMTVPQRREELEKAEKRIKEEAPEKYEALLQEARTDGFMGNETIKRYMEEFNKIDPQDKSHWYREMKNGNQLKDYKALWSNIRNTFPKDSPYLSEIEGMRDSKGLSGITKEFPKMCDKEYDHMLEREMLKGIISPHTRSEYSQDMKKEGMSIEAKQYYLESFDHEMERYKVLRSQVDGLETTNPDAHKELVAMYKSETDGFTEIQGKYDELVNQKSANQTPGKKKSSKLDQIIDPTIRKGIEKANESLKKKGGRQKQLWFAQQMKRMVIGTQDNTYNESGFQDQLSQMRKKKLAKEDRAEKTSGEKESVTNSNVISLQHRLKKERISKRKQHSEPEAAEPIEREIGENVIDMQNYRLKKRRALYEQDSESLSQEIEHRPVAAKDSEKNERRDTGAIDKSAVQEDIKTIENSEGTRIVQSEGFRQVEIKEGNKTHRNTLVEINWEKGLESLDIETQRRAFRNKLEGGNDNLSYALRKSDGRTEELNLQQVRVAQEFIEEDALSSPESEEEEKMAA